MSKPGRAHYYEDGNEQHVANLELTELRFLTTLFSEKELREIHGAWRRRDGDVVPRTRFPSHRIQIVDLSEADPDDWMVYERGGAGWAPRMETGFLRECLLNWVRKCRREGAPLFQHVEQTVGGATAAYFRLLLPIATAEGGTVESVLVLMDLQSETVTA